MLRTLEPHEIGRRVRETRIAAGLTQEELAEALGWNSPTSIWRIEQGFFKSMDFEKLVQLANHTAGTGMLRSVPPIGVLDYLEGRTDEIHVRIGSSRSD